MTPSRSTAAAGARYATSATTAAIRRIQTSADDRARAADDAAGGIDQLLAPEQRDHRRGGDPAELPAAGDERPDPGERRRDQDRDGERPERGVRADGGIEPRGEDDRRREEQRVPRHLAGALHAAAPRAGWRAGFSLRSGASRPGFRAGRGQRWTARAMWVRKKNGMARAAASAAWMTMLPAPGSM